MYSNKILIFLFLMIGFVNAGGNWYTGLTFDSDFYMRGHDIAYQSTLKDLNNTVYGYGNCISTRYSPDSSCVTGYKLYLYTCNLTFYACGNNQIASQWNPLRAYETGFYYNGDANNLQIVFSAFNNINNNPVLYSHSTTPTKSLTCSDNRTCDIDILGLICINETGYNTTLPYSKIELVSNRNDYGYDKNVSGIFNTGLDTPIKLSDSDTLYLLPTASRFTQRERLEDNYGIDLCGASTTTTTTTSTTTTIPPINPPFNVTTCDIFFSTIDYDTGLPVSNAMIVITSLTGEYGYVTNGSGIAKVLITCGNRYSGDTYREPDYTRQDNFNDMDFSSECNSTIILQMRKFITINYSVYVNKDGCNLNNALNEVKIFYCTNPTYYNNPDWQILTDNCINLINGLAYTNTNGFYNKTGITIDQAHYYLGAVKHFDSVYEFYNYERFYPILNLNNNFNFNVSYSCGSGIGNEVCFESIDANTIGNIITTTYKIFDGGNLLYSGTGSKNCMNLTDLAKIYRFVLNASTFNDVDIDYQFLIDDSQYTPHLFYMYKSGAYVNVSNTFNISGYAIMSENDAILGGAKITACLNKYTVTSLSGYTIEGIPYGTFCILSIDTNGAFNDYSKTAYVTGNIKDFNFTLNRNTNENTREIDLLIEYIENDGTYIPINNAHVIFKTNGRSDVSLYSDNNGHVIFNNAYEDTDYTAIITAYGFDEKSISISNSENYKEVILIKSLKIDCSLSGITSLTNNSINQPLKNVEVKLYLDGNKISSYITGLDGLYDFNIECDKSYSVSADYNGIIQTYSIRAISAEHPIIQDFSFTALNIGRENQKEGIINYMWLFLTPIAYIVITLLGIIVIYKLLDELS